MALRVAAGCPACPWAGGGALGGCQACPPARSCNGSAADTARGHVAAGDGDRTFHVDRLPFGPRGLEHRAALGGCPGAGGRGRGGRRLGRLEERGTEGGGG